MSTNSEIFDSFEPFKLFESFNLLLDLRKNAQESRFYGKDDIVRYADDAIKKMKDKVKKELDELGTYRPPAEYISADATNDDDDHWGGKRGLSKSYKKRINKNKRTKRNRK